MCKIPGTILLLIWFAATAAAQSAEPPCKPIEEPNSERDGFIGRVKIVRTFKTSFNRPRRLEEEASYSLAGKRIKWRNVNYLPLDPADELVSEYDCESSNRIAEIRYKRLKDSSFRKTVYRYDDKGRTSEQAEYFADGTLERLETYSYDDNGNRIEEIVREQVHPEHFTPKRFDVYVTTKTTYEYDSKGNKIKETHFSPDGSLYATWTFRIDLNRRRTKEVRVDKVGRLEDVFIYIYNRRGQLREEWHYANFCYERDGQMCEGRVQSSDGPFYSLTKTIYEYDRIGNWIRERQFSKDSEKNTNGFELDHTISRQISYYPSNTRLLRTRR